MTKTNTTRKSHCKLCGKRLSAVTATGNIRWKPSIVNDEGIYCEGCAPRPEEPKGKKPPRT